MTANAVRAHLSVLERDGLVSQVGVRRETRKPAYLYGLTEDAERLFPKALGAVLREFLHVLVARLDRRELEAALRETGKRLGKARVGRRDADLHHRVDEGVQALVDLGGTAHLEKHDGCYTIHGLDCPFHEVVSQHPQLCLLAEALLEEVVGMPVRQRCEVRPARRCLFEISPNGGGRPTGPTQPAQRQGRSGSLKHPRRGPSR